MLPPMVRWRFGASGTKLNRRSVCGSGSTSSPFHRTSVRRPACNRCHYLCGSSTQTGEGEPPADLGRNAEPQKAKLKLGVQPETRPSVFRVSSMAL